MFEYLVKDCPLLDDTERWLNVMAEEDWELVTSIYRGPSNISFVFKREVPRLM